MAAKVPSLTRLRLSNIEELRKCSGHRLAGDHSEVEIPVPIPNTVVKHLCADGTARETSWESRTLPALFEEPPVRENWGLFLFPERSFLSARLAGTQTACERLQTFAPEGAHLLGFLLGMQTTVLQLHLALARALVEEMNL